VDDVIQRETGDADIFTRTTGVPKQAFRYHTFGNRVPDKDMSGTRP